MTHRRTTQPLSKTQEKNTANRNVTEIESHMQCPDIKHPVDPNQGSTSDRGGLTLTDAPDPVPNR